MSGDDTESGWVGEPPTPRPATAAPPPAESRPAAAEAALRRVRVEDLRALDEGDLVAYGKHLAAAKAMLMLAKGAGADRWYSELELQVFDATAAHDERESNK